jgi:PAT family beta-lactamase induction signal transducer AmpG
MLTFLDKRAGGMGQPTNSLWYSWLISLTIGESLRKISFDGKWMLPMILAMHLPIIGIHITFIFTLNPFTSYMVIVEWLWVWFAAFMMYLNLAGMESQRPPHSIATGFMALGMMLPEC